VGINLGLETVDGLLDMIPKTQITIGKIGKLNIVKIRKFCVSKTPSLKGKDNLYFGGKVLQITCLIKDLY
jgi:hypothetical protein